MEYVFGTADEVEILKTKGDAHTDLTGWQEVEQVYPDQTVTDRFRVLRKLDSQEDGEDKCYDWYEIDRHNRTVDKTVPVAQEVAKVTANIDYLSMMTGVDLPDAEEKEETVNG